MVEGAAIFFLIIGAAFGWPVKSFRIPGEFRNFGHFTVYAGAQSSEFGYVSNSSEGVSAKSGSHSRTTITRVILAAS